LKLPAVLEMKAIVHLKAQSQVEIWACPPFLGCGCITGIPPVTFDLDSQIETLPHAVSGVDRGFALEAERPAGPVAQERTEGSQGQSVLFSAVPAEW
jgi:hypothetical protein